MALRIGKKKDQPSDDWSESASQGDPATTGSTPPSTTTGTEPADAFVADNFAPATPPKKGLSPVLLAAGLVLLLTAAGVGAYFMFMSPSAETTDTTVAVVPPGDPAAPVEPTPPTEPAPPVNPAAPAKPATPAAKPAPVVVKPQRNAPAKKVAPGRAGLVPPGTKVPAVRPQGGKPPAVAPRPNQPTPVPIMPDGVAAQSGRGLPEGAAVPAVQPTPPLTPALKARLKTLWQQGAAAKWRGDKAGARKAWMEMLRLRPGHPGVQEAINKL